MTLTSPIGTATNRHFNIFAGGNQSWSISALPANPNINLIPTLGVMRLVIPQNYAGSITLKVGVQSYVINVVVNRPKSIDLRVGETFNGGNTEWRILAKSGNQALLISEHVLFDDRIEPSPYMWSVTGWHSTMLRGDLNTLVAPFFPDRPAESWVGPITTQPTTVRTKLGINGPNYSILQNQLWFLLSEDEVFGGSSGGNPTNNLFAGTNLFADNASRSATRLVYYSTNWWLRSPSGNVEHAATVQSDGSASNTRVNSFRGIRPACVIVLSD